MKTTVASVSARAASTLTKKAGDISSIFSSLSGKRSDPLPARYSELKKRRIAGKEDAVSRSWHRLLDSLKQEIAEVKREGNKVGICTIEIVFTTTYQRR